MTDSRNSISLAGPGSMFLSAVLFGYFGFMIAWPQLTTTNPPQIIPMVVALKWTLRIGAIVFLLSGLLAMAQTIVANSIYAIAGLFTAVFFIVAAVWDYTNAQNYSTGIHPILLLVLAAWNGFASTTTLRDLWHLRRSPATPNFVEQ